MGSFLVCSPKDMGNNYKMEGQTRTCLSCEMAIMILYHYALNMTSHLWMRPNVYVRRI